MKRLITMFCLFFINGYAQECVNFDINKDKKQDSFCIEIKNDKPLLKVLLSGQESIINDNLIDENIFFSGKDSEFIDISPDSYGLEFQLSNILFNVQYKNNTLILSSIVVFDSDHPTVYIKGQKGTFVSLKKTLVKQSLADFKFKSLKNIYPNSKESCSNLNTLLTNAKNNIFSNDIDVYNAIFGCGIFDSTVQKSNDLLFFYLKHNIFSFLIGNSLLGILEVYPQRTVAYYNLADAYWALGEKEKARKSYTTYIEQMCAKGLQKKIPKEVLKRVERKNVCK